MMKAGYAGCWPVVGRLVDLTPCMSGCWSMEHSSFQSVPGDHNHILWRCFLSARIILFKANFYSEMRWIEWVGYSKKTVQQDKFWNMGSRC